MTTLAEAVTTVRLALPGGIVPATYLGDIGTNFHLLGFERDMLEKDLQGPNCRFPWTERSKASLTEANGKPRKVNCIKLAMYCSVHNLYWLRSENQDCPECSQENEQ